MKIRLTVSSLAFLLICLAMPLAALSQTPSTEEGIEDVILDRETASTYPLKAQFISRHCKENSVINVSPIANSSERKIFTFYFFVTGGEIEKYGGKANWHLGDVKPGKYSITVGIGLDGVIWGKTVTKTVSVMPCEIDVIPCECAQISVSGPTGLARYGDTLIFTANVTGGTQDSVKYNWAVSSGTIVSGQGTPNILVETDKNKKVSVVTATVDIGGLCPECPRTASSTVELKDK
jgi:hypothetical protein